jgi:hypothetical protein
MDPLYLAWAPIDVENLYYYEPTTTFVDFTALHQQSDSFA